MNKKISLKKQRFKVDIIKNKDSDKNKDSYENVKNQNLVAKNS